MKKSLLMLLMVIPTCLQAADDIRAYLRTDGGYDFFDYAGTLVYFSVPNEKGSYDFFDRTGSRAGWAEMKGSNRIEYYDASGTLYRVLERSVSGNVAISSALGKLYNLSAPNALNGVDNYDPKGLLTSYTASGEYIIVKPDDPE